MLSVQIEKCLMHVSYGNHVGSIQTNHISLPIAKHRGPLNTLMTLSTQYLLKSSNAAQLMVLSTQYLRTPTDTVQLMALCTAQLTTLNTRYPLRSKDATQLMPLSTQYPLTPTDAAQLMVLIPYQLMPIDIVQSMTISIQSHSLPRQPKQTQLLTFLLLLLLL